MLRPSSWRAALLLRSQYPQVPPICGNKVDLVDSATVERIKQRIRALHQRSEIDESSYAEVDLDAILGIRRWRGWCRSERSDAEVDLDAILGIRAFEVSQRAAAEPSFLDDHYVHIHACMSALRTGRPVRMVYGREESFFGHVHRPPAVADVELGRLRVVEMATGLELLRASVRPADLVVPQMEADAPAG